MFLITDEAPERKSHVTETKEHKRNKPEKNVTFLGETRSSSAEEISAFKNKHFYNVNSARDS